MNGKAVPVHLNREPTPRQRWLAVGGTTALAAVAIFWPRPDRSPAPAPLTTTSSAAVAPSSPTTLPTSTSSTVPGPATSPVQPAPESTKAADLEAARQTASAFTSAWLTPGTPEERTAALAPHASPGLVALVADVPVESLPPFTVTGVQGVEFDGYTAHVTMGLSDGSAVVVDVVETAVGWRAVDVRRAGS